MKFLLAIFRFLRDLASGQLGKERAMPDLEEIAKNVADKFVEEIKKAPDELMNVLEADTKKFIKDLADPALELGEDMVKAILFGEALALLYVEELTDEQVAALTDQEALRREARLAAQAEQLAKVAQAEAEHQEAAAEVRAKSKAFLTGLLKKAGRIGLGILTSSLIAI